MDTVLQAFISWQFIFFCLACAAITFVARTIIEYVLDNPNVPASKHSKFWKDLFLPLLPIFFGPMGAWLASGFPYPDGLGNSSARVVFGLVAGFLSGIVYRIVKSFLVSKITAPTEEEAAAIRQSINKD
jgi:uncharacterized membrane protein YedE/YeeE